MADNENENGRTLNGDRANPLSWRDVYHAVERSEDKILKELAEVKTEIITQLDEHDTRIRANEQWRHNYEASKAAKGQMWTTTRVLVVTTAGVGAFLVSFLNFLLINLMKV